MHARARGLCSGVRSKIAVVRDFLLLVGTRGARAPDSCYFPRMPYARRFLDFCVRRFDNKLQLAFDRVRCWFVEVLLTSQLGRRSRCREKRRLDFEKCSTWSVALIFANCAGELFIASWIAEYYYMKRFC